MCSYTCVDTNSLSIMNSNEDLDIVAYKDDSVLSKCDLGLVETKNEFALNADDTFSKKQSSTSEPLNDSFDQDMFPQPPEKPQDSDCCGTGCIPCVFDIYTQELEIWEKECLKIKQRQLLGQGNKQNENVEMLSKTEYRQFTIECVTRETQDTCRYRCTLPLGRSLGLQLGQHVIIRGQVGEEVITRQYTPISSTEAAGHFDLLIKIYKKGKLSQYIQNWKKGTILEMRGPFGELSYFPNKYRRLVMLAAGTGIAPMAQVIKGVLNNQEDDTRIQLLYACRNYDGILMKAELNEWKQFWNFSVLYILSQEPKEVSANHYRYGDKIHRGRLDFELLSSEIQPSSLNNTKILISGTKSFDKDMIKYCKCLELCDCDIHKF